MSAIDIDERAENETAREFIEAVKRALDAERRLSSVVRLTLRGDRVDFRVTYLGKVASQ